ncbi:DUF1292 domain-containing protein [Paenibacillus sp. N1-5-1-14]|uniref:DUF1292 domain-containing protein n=1 Tax=Paenibacillus radicibacter TaxID=2972488 RepID=UPI0021598D7A|nr:DUF1292 domain-containing protein [Paenibacillus radicibacter]MCR8644078.1 DUF1292 domain-containing protein [Paenibacillus radicibacter]
MSVVQTNVLQGVYGDEIILVDEQEESTAFKIMAEFDYEGSKYAVLQSDELEKEEEVVIYRITSAAEGQYELETIEDDDEWEAVSEQYDEIAYPIDIEE